jgi:DNA-binding GntR family transcriptional regulator
MSASSARPPPLAAESASASQLFLAALADPFAAVLDTAARAVRSEGDTSDAANRERLAERSADNAAVVRLASEFHLKLAAMSRNAHVARLMDELVGRTRMLVAALGGPTACCAHAEHPAIVRAIRERDGATAARHLIEHLSYIESPRRRDVRDLSLLVDEQWRARARGDT